MIRCPAVLLRSPLALICLLALAAGGVTHAAAQSYPARSIKLVVPFGPGGPTDVSARIVAQVVQAGLGTSVVIKTGPERAVRLEPNRSPTPTPTAPRCSSARVQRSASCPRW